MITPEEKRKQIAAFREKQEKEHQEKTTLLVSAGYTEAEINELEKDEYELDKTAGLIKGGHTKKEIEQVGATEIIKKDMKEAGFSGVAIETFEKEGFISEKT